MGEVRERAKRQLADGEAQAWRVRGGDQRKPPEPQPCQLNRGNYSEARDPDRIWDGGTPSYLSNRTFK